MKAKIRKRISLLFLGLGVGLLMPGCNSYSLKEGERGRWELKETPAKPEWTDRDKKVPFIVAALPPKVPRHFLLSQLPPPGNQGAQASGTAWAAGYFAASYRYRQKKDAAKDYQCAPAFVYNSLNNGVDRGIEIADALELLKKHGCPRENYMPYTSQDPAYQPTSRARQDAARYRIDGFGRVDYMDLDQVRAHLIQKRPVIITMLIARNFIQLDEAVWEYPEGAVRGRHSAALIGYDDEKKTIPFSQFGWQRLGPERALRYPLLLVHTPY